MKQTPERLLYKWIMDGMPPGYHVQRIETTTAPGVPDMNMAVGGRELWLEVKASRVTKSGVVIRKEQYAWMIRRVTCLGICIVLLKEGKQWMLWDMRNQRDPGVIKAISSGIHINCDPDYTGETAKELADTLKEITQ